MISKLQLATLIVLLLIFGFQTSGYSRSQDNDDLIIQSDELEQEEKEVNEELYHGDKKQDLQYDKEQNEFIDGSEQDEIDYELKQEKQDLESKKRTMDEIDAIEEEINEQP